MTRSRVLDQTDLFGQMPPDLLTELSGRTELTKFRRNELICTQGEDAERLFIVFSGRVAITVKATDGRESVVAVLGPGALFGELPLFDGATRFGRHRARSAPSISSRSATTTCAACCTTVPKCCGRSCAS